MLFASSPDYYRLAVSYLYAANMFLLNSYELADRTIDHAKLEAYARRFAAKHFPLKSQESCEKRRFLSSICADGIVTLEETPALLCRRLYLIDDDCGAVSHTLLSLLRQFALKSGHEVITCCCPMNPERKIEHLLIPSAGVGFLTSNPFHPMSHCSSLRKIHASRFMDQEQRKELKARFVSNHKAAHLLLQQAVALLHENRQIHDRLEEHYREAMNFEELNHRIPQFFRMIEEHSSKEMS